AVSICEIVPENLLVGPSTIILLHGQGTIPDMLLHRLLIVSEMRQIIRKAGKIPINKLLNSCTNEILHSSF
ncbi:MAG: hypothetical protein IJ968_00255, partial [Clostridia bacterium]|nr:hypothetical protein [Clostridia bacterium]